MAMVAVRQIDRRLASTMARHRKARLHCATTVTIGGDTAVVAAIQRLNIGKNEHEIENPTKSERKEKEKTCLVAVGLVQQPVRNKHEVSFQRDCSQFGRESNCKLQATRN
jgi:hypothetical protein